MAKNRPVEELALLHELATLKNEYETGADDARKKAISQRAAQIRQMMGDPNLGANLNAKQFGEKYGVNYQPVSVKKDGVYVGNQLSSPQKTVSQKTVSQNTPSQITNQTQSNAQSYIDQLNAARKKQVVSQLDKSRNAALSNLDAEKSSIQPRFYDAKNQVAAQNQQQARNFAEFMAARGGARSGSNAQAEISRNMALQGNLGALGRQETQAYQDIARRTTDVQNAYQSDVASATAGLEADRMKALLNDYYIAQQRGDKLAQLAIQNELARAQMTGNLDGQRTLQGQQMDFNRQFQRDQFDYQRERDQVGDARWEAQFNEDSQRFGLQYALQRQVQMGNLSARQAEMALARQKYQSDQAWREKTFEADQAWKQKAYDLETQPTAQPGPSMEDAVKMAQKDPLFFSMSPEEQQQLIQYYYEMLQPSSISDEELMQKYLK